MSMEQPNPYASPAGSEPPHYLPASEVRFGRILNTGLRLYISNLPAILVITLVVWTPLEIFQAYMEYFVFDPEDFRSVFRLEQAMESLFGIIATASVISIQAAAMRGERLSAWEGLGEGVAAWPRMFWTRLVTGLLLVLAYLALVIPGIFLTFRLALVEPVAVIEHTSGGDCIKRTYQLTTGRFWMMLGLIGGSVFTVMLLTIAMFTPLGLFPEIDHWLISGAISLVTDVLVQIPTSIAVAAYFACLHDVDRAIQASAAGASSGISMPSIKLASDRER